MVDANKTPADNGKYNYFISSLAFDAKDYATARAAAQAAIQAGYSVDEASVLLAETYIAENQPTQGLAELRKAVASKRAAGQPVPEAWIKRAVTVAYKAKLQSEAADWALTQVELYPNNFNWLASTQLVRLVGNYGPNETIDLFRLMMRSGAFNNDPKLLGNEYKEYIEAADPRRLPGEVIMVVDKGKAAGALTGQWPNDMRALAAGRINADKASLAAAPSAASNGVTLLSTGDAWLNYADPAKAEAFFKAALAKGGVDRDRVLTRIGIAQFDQGKYAEAKASFAQVGGTRTAMAKLWLSLIKSKAPTA
jgi:tetratricopeptide (TPR) repeat protein